MDGIFKPDSERSTRTFCCWGLNVTGGRERERRTEKMQGNHICMAGKRTSLVNCKTWSNIRQFPPAVLKWKEKKKQQSSVAVSSSSANETFSSGYCSLLSQPRWGAFNWEQWAITDGEQNLRAFNLLLQSKIRQKKKKKNPQKESVVYFLSPVFFFFIICLLTCSFWCCWKWKQHKKVFAQGLLTASIHHRDNHNG